MHIFIDESGIFAIPQTERVSCVAALVLPSRWIDRVTAEFAELRGHWQMSGVEVKGSKLSESQIAQTIDLLYRNGALLEAVPIEMAWQREDDLTAYRLKYVADLATAVPGDKPEVIELREQLRTIISGISNQLFVQARVMPRLIRRVLGTPIIYHAIHNPPELGEFHWSIDAKNEKLTPYEVLWTRWTVPTILTEGGGIETPHQDGADYSWLWRFRRKGTRSGKRSGRKQYDAELLLTEHRDFANSADRPGLQLADILANAMCRAFNLGVSDRTCRLLGSLMIRRACPTFKLAALADEMLDKPLGLARHANTRARILDGARCIDEAPEYWKNRERRR